MITSPKTSLKSLVMNLGISEIEVDVYIATLESGNGTASSIAKIVGKQRITTYEVLKRLSKSGLIKIKVKPGSKIKHFSPIGLQEIKNKILSKKTELEESLKSMDIYRDAFQNLYRRNQQKPEVLFFESVQGVMSAMHDTLDQKPNEIISFSSDKWLDSVFDPHFLQEYWGRRVKLGIHTRGIIPKVLKATSYFNKEKNEKELRRIRCIPKEQFNFKNEIDVYGNNICIVSLEEGNEHAVIIRSQSLAQSMRDVFEVMWLAGE